LDYIPANENHSFEYGLFPNLLARKEPFFAHIPQKTYWLDIGTPARYLQAHHDLLGNRVTRLRLKERRGNFDAATHADIDELSMIGDDCTIKPGAQIINSVLGQGCYIEEKRASKTPSSGRIRVSAQARNCSMQLSGAAVT
jgi:NDP-sugar pyrophosphorylase family protein